MNLANWALRTSPKFTTGVIISYIKVFDRSEIWESQSPFASLWLQCFSIHKTSLLVDIVSHGAATKSEDYVAILKKFQARLCRVRPHRQKQDVLLLHDNARPQVSHKTTGEIIKRGWTTLKR